MVYVVIDSTEFCADFQMTGGNFRVLFDYLVKTGEVLCVPEVVVDEVSNRYAETLKSSRQKLSKEMDELRDSRVENSKHSEI